MCFANISASSYSSKKCSDMRERPLRCHSIEGLFPSLFPRRARSWRILCGRRNDVNLNTHHKILLERRTNPCNASTGTVSLSNIYISHAGLYMLLTLPMHILPLYFIVFECYVFGLFPLLYGMLIRGKSFFTQIQESSPINVLLSKQIVAKSVVIPMLLVCQLL